MTMSRPGRRIAPMLFLAIAGRLASSIPAEAAVRFSPYPTVAELSAYLFAADTEDATALYLNPAGLAGGRGTNFYLDLSGTQNGAEEGSVALQGGSFALGYRHHDVGGSFDLSGGSGPVTLVVPKGNFDAYFAAGGFGPPAFRLGTTREWTQSDVPDADYKAWHLGVQSRVDRRLSLAATARNVGSPSFRGGELNPRFTYGVAVRPLPRAPESVTLNVEATHEQGEDRFDMAYGLRVATKRGVDLALQIQDPNGGSPEFGGSLTVHWGQSAISARGRFPGGDLDPRWQVAAQAYDEFWRRSLPGGRKVATLTLEGDYADQPSGFVLTGSESRGAHDVIHRIEHAARDRDVRALAVRIEALSGTFLGPVSAQLEEMRVALLDFRASGKPVVAYLGGMANGPAEVYMASAADRVILTPLGGVYRFGVSVHIEREKRFFEKLGVAWEADTAGVYKSSFHGFYTDTTSALQRVAIEGLVDHEEDYLLRTVQGARKISDADMADIATGRIVFPEECVRTGLADSLGWWEDALREADRLAGGRGERVPATFRLPRRVYRTERWVPPPAVAVVVAEGDIRSGTSGRNWLMGGRSMGSSTVARQLRAAAATPGVLAVVLRVDSGGGSALASEEIRQAVRKVRRDRRLPIFVSMGTAAASGGYWISMDADSIFADRMTRTGSIGVVWAVPVVEELYRRLGITSETFKRGEHTDMMTTARPLTEEERAMLDAALDHTYDWFVKGVAQGRNLPEARVRELAEGRVYFGEQARERGLVDAIGTLNDAVQAAAARVGIERDYRVLTFSPPSGGFLERALSVVRVMSDAAGRVLGRGTGVEAEDR